MKTVRKILAFPFKVVHLIVASVAAVVVFGALFAGGFAVIVAGLAVALGALVALLVWLIGAAILSFFSRALAAVVRFIDPDFKGKDAVKTAFDRVSGAAA